MMTEYSGSSGRFSQVGQIRLLLIIHFLSSLIHF